MFGRIFLSAFILSIMSLVCSGADESGTVSVTINAGTFTIEKTDRGDEIRMNGFGRLPDPGVPMLPAKIFSVAVPPGAEVTGVTFESGRQVVLDGTYSVPPVPLPELVIDETEPLPPLARADRTAYEANHESVYGQNDFYPASCGELVRNAGYRKYELVDVRVRPFAWNPKSGQLVLHPAVTVNVHYTLPEGAGQAIPDNMIRTEKVARDIVANYDQAQTWYGGARAGRGLYDFVIVTLDSLTTAVQPLVAWEEGKGRTVYVATTTWIYANYTGYDNAEKIRNFLRDKYPSGEWGIEDVLLVGHYDDVPMRRCEQDVGYGKPETDFYYAELSEPDSLSWDSNGNHLYGENNDNVDFYNEVNVGRIPWSDAATVDSICDKSVAYENNADPAYKKNILLLGAYFWADTDNAVLMEYKTDPTLHPWMTDWTAIRMYEQNSSYYSSYPCDYELLHSNVMAVWPAGQFSFVNWAGHGSPTSCHIYGIGAPAFISSSDCPSLNDNYPAIIFADACSNSDTDYLNIGQAMLKQGGIGFLGATKVAYGCGSWSHPSHGSSQSMDYYFTVGCTSGDYTQGEAHQSALRTMYTDGLWYYVYYEMFEWGALWGNPDLSMGTAPAMSYSFPYGLPEGQQPPGPEITMTFEIRDGTEHYVPGSGYLCYRFDSGNAYTQVALTELGGGLFEATLPGPVPGDEPEFYFTADTDGGQTITSPFGAPGNVYSFDVCLVAEMLHDDFEDDLGWTVVNTNVDTGAWVRGVPSQGGGRGDTPNDSDGSGKCYITGNTTDEDLDGGPTELFSPLFDLSSGDAQVSYDRWHYNDDGDDYLVVEISNDGGVSWTQVESLLGNGGWVNVAFNVSDYVTPTGQMQMCFTSSDQPNDSVTESGLDAFVVRRLNYFPDLYADAYDLSVTTGKSIDFMLDAGVTYANRNYLLLASLDGSSPGMDVNGVHIPLNWDWVSDYIYGHLYLPVFQEFWATLDGQGRAIVDFDLSAAPGLAPYVGQDLTFVFAVTGPVDFASNPIEVEVGP